jgi:hypothetical protein
VGCDFGLLELQRKHLSPLSWKKQDDQTDSYYNCLEQLKMLVEDNKKIKITLTERIEKSESKPVSERQ